MKKDNKDRYGTISRLLHWGMALLALLQLLSAGAHYLLEDTAVEKLLWPLHKPVGFLLFVLILVRIIWALVNASKRPHSVSMMAKLGHISLYLLLLVVPTVALIRQYGSGKAFEPFGLPFFSGFDTDKIEWMTDLGSQWHGLLGWVLFLLVVGHVIMSFIHKKSPSKENVIKRMW